MENCIKVISTVVSHAGSAYVSSDDNFYMNGRSKYSFELDKIQVSSEKNESDYIFAVYDGIDDEADGETNTASITRELHKFQDHLKNNMRSMETKLNQFGECINEVNNVIFSFSLGDPELKGKRNSFAGLLISDGKLGAINTGNNRIFLMRSGNLKHITKDNAKLDRLLKLGIITPDQAKALAVHFNTPSEPDSSKPFDSELMDVKTNDIFLICNDGITDNLDDEQIQGIMSQGHDPDFIANMLVKEALDKQSAENMTAMVVWIVNKDGGDYDDKEEYVFPARPRRTDKTFKKEEVRSESIKTYAAAIITTLILAAILFIAYKAWYNYYNKDQEAGNQAVASSQSSTSGVAIASEETNGLQTDSTEEQTDPISPQPSASPSSGSASGEEPVKYIIQSGDSLMSISRKFYKDDLKYKIIMEKNNITDPNSIKAGDTIIIP